SDVRARGRAGRRRRARGAAAEARGASGHRESAGDRGGGVGGARPRTHARPAPAARDAAVPGRGRRRDAPPRARARRLRQLPVRRRDAAGAARGRRACQGGRVAVQASFDVSADPPALRASDAERERAVELLRAQAGEGRLTLEELAQRIETAYASRTREELERITADLPAATAASAPAPRRRSTRFTWVALGDVERKGRWRIAGQSSLVVAFG